MFAIRQITDGVYKLKQSKHGKDDIYEKNTVIYLIGAFLVYVQPLLSGLNNIEVTPDGA